MPRMYWGLEIQKQSLLSQAGVGSSMTFIWSGKYCEEAITKKRHRRKVKHTSEKMAMEGHCGDVGI